MEITRIAKVTDTEFAYSFRSTSCDECDFRFGCYTMRSACCPLIAVRLLIDYSRGDNHFISPFYTVEVEINEKLGEFDGALLSMIANRLQEVWSEGKQESPESYGEGKERGLEECRKPKTKAQAC